MRKQGVWAGFFGLMALAGLARLNAQTNLTLDDSIRQSAAVRLRSSINVWKDSRFTALAGDEAPDPWPAAEDPNASAGYPPELNFSTGRKVGAGFLNMFFFGAGSFSMGDWGGGLLVGGLQAASWALYVVGGIELNNALFELLGNPVDGTESAEKKLRTSTIFLISSGVVTLAQIAVGFVRPFTYDTALAKKNGAYTGLDTNPLEHINIAIVPDRNGPAALNLSYSFSY